MEIKSIGTATINSFGANNGKKEKQANNINRYFNLFVLNILYSKKFELRIDINLSKILSPTPS